MIVTHYVTIDLQDKGAVPQIDATQDDQYTRDLAIRLMEGDSAWTIPEDAAVVIRYCKSDGVGGEYDTMPDGSAAWSAEGNVLRLALAPQVLTCPGTVMLSATMIREEEVLSIFSVAISVRPRVQGIFGESEAYYNVSGFLPGPVKAEKGQYLRIARVDSRGRVVAVEGANAPAGGSVSAVEPAEEDIPKVFFGAALPQTKDDTVMTFRYISKTEDISGYCKTKAQGNSSMSYPKKNQTVKLYKDAACTEKLKVDFKGWGKQNKFCFKANWIDLTHARNIVSARLWGDVVKSRANYDTIPEQLKTSPNQGAVDGFPVKVYAEGIYQGRYTLNIPKDAWMANMDEDQETHCILCGENYGSGCFRAEANIDGSDWTDEVHKTVPAAIKNRWNDAIRFVMNSSDDEFVAGIGHYFDIPSLIDYYIFGVVSCGLDAFGKNQLYMTWDGMKWYATMYDMDSTWGLWWNGSSFVASDYARSEFQDYADGDGNLLYIRLESLFADEIRMRWEKLKNGALSVGSIINRFERFTDIAPPYLVEEDYAATTAEGAFAGIPQTGANNIRQIRGYVNERLTWLKGDLIETDVLYQLPEAMDFDGSSVYIDTGVKLFKENKDFAFTFEFSGNPAAYDSTLFNCVYETAPWPGVSMDTKGTYYRYGNVPTNIAITDTNRHKGVVVKNASSGTITVYWDGMKNVGTLTSNVTVTHNVSLHLGAKPNTDGTKSNFYAGTIHNFTVYNRMLSSDEIDAYFKNGASSDDPLYPLFDGSISGARGTVTVSNGNHVRATSNGAGSLKFSLNDVTLTSDAGGGDPYNTKAYYTIPAGSAVNLVVKNWSWTGTVGNNTVIFMLRDTSGTETQLINRSKSSIGTDTEFSGLITVETEMPVGGFCMFISWSSDVYTIEYDVELYVNGVRYV